MTLNKVQLIGNLGRDPEFKKSASNIEVSRISIATKFKEKTEWHNVILFKQQANFANKYLKKGDLVYIEGSLETQEFEKNGVKRKSTKINAHVIQGLKKASGDIKPTQLIQTKPIDTMSANLEAEFNDGIPF